MIDPQVQEKMLNTVLVFKEEHPKEYAKIEEMIKKGETGMDLVNAIRDCTKLGLIQAVQIRTSFIHVLL